MQIGAVILAAGKSSRMGSPKALLPYRGETFLSRLVRVMGLVCDPVVVVLGHHAERLHREVPKAARIALNPDPERGQLSSLQTGLEALGDGPSGFAFIPVDCPAVEEDTVRKLAEAYDQRTAETCFVIPRMGSEQEGYRRGHPVFGTPEITAELLALDPTDEARKIVHACVDRTQYVEVLDEGIFTDIDDPEAYRELIDAAQSDPGANR